MLQVIGASYTDEATKTTMTMAVSDFMSAVLPTVACGTTVTGVWITPVTAMAQSRAAAMSNGMTDANIAAANLAMGNYFMVGDILHTQPMNPLVAGSSIGASRDAHNYGMALAAISQYAKNLNLTNSSTLISAMMSDASDGMMNGKKGFSQIPISMGEMMGTILMASTLGTAGLIAAMSEFMTSVANVSGLTLTDMATLMQRLNGSNGSI